MYAGADGDVMGPERALFLLVAFATHGVVGYALVRAFTDVEPAVGFLIALLPDVDFLLSAAWGGLFVHRGVTHTPAFVLFLVAGAYAVAHERTHALAVGLALGSHLAIDSLSPAGVAWLYPFGGRVAPGLPVHGPAATVLLWTFAAAVVTWDERRRRTERDPAG